MSYNRQPSNGIRKGVHGRPQYSSPIMSAIRAEFERILGDREAALNCMDGLTRIMSEQRLYLARIPGGESALEDNEPGSEETPSVG